MRAHTDGVGLTLACLGGPLGRHYLMATTALGVR